MVLTVKFFVTICLISLSIAGNSQSEPFSAKIASLENKKLPSGFIQEFHASQSTLTIPSTLSVDRFWQHSIQFSAYDNYRFYLEGNEGLNPRRGNIHTGLIFLMNRVQGKDINKDIFFPY